MAEGAGGCRSRCRSPGIEVVPTPWTAHDDDAAGLRGFDCGTAAAGVGLSSTRWLRVCATWERARSPGVEPGAGAGVESDKRYLSTGPAARRWRFRRPPSPTMCRRRLVDGVLPRPARRN